ncbi:hypothetical protein CCYA_CCYA13G3445 [Cyanidiococcus yangmingshanensis]|nr:hypothetical protein CCYA_CCYA13G3445 [Cyanidiococcus yangmingshanensis]
MSESGTVADSSPYRPGPKTGDESRQSSESDTALDQSEEHRVSLKQSAANGTGAQSQTCIQCAPEYIGVLQFLVAFRSIINEEVKAYFRAGRMRKPTHALLHEIDAACLERDLVDALRTLPSARDDRGDHAADESDDSSQATGETRAASLLAHVHAALLNCLRLRKVEAQRASGKHGWIQLLATELRSRPDLYDMSGSGLAQDSSLCLYDRDGTSVLDRCSYSTLSPMLRVLILQSLCDVVAETNDRLRRAIWEAAKKEQEIGIRRRRRGRRRDSVAAPTTDSTAARSWRGSVSTRSAQAPLRNSSDPSSLPNQGTRSAANASLVEQGLRAGDEAARFGPLGEDDQGWRYWIPGGLRAAAACGCVRMYRFRDASIGQDAGGACAPESEPVCRDAPTMPPPAVCPEIQIVVHSYANLTSDIERLYAELGGKTMSHRNRKLWNLLQSAIIPELENGYLNAEHQRNRRVRLTQAEVQDAPADHPTKLRDRRERSGRQRPIYNEDELFDAVFDHRSDSSEWADASHTEDESPFESDTSWSQANESKERTYLESEADTDSSNGEDHVVRGESPSSDDVAFEVPARHRPRGFQQPPDRARPAVSNRSGPGFGQTYSAAAREAGVNDAKGGFDRGASALPHLSAQLSKTASADRTNTLQRNRFPLGCYTAASYDSRLQDTASRSTSLNSSCDFHDDPIDDFSSDL